MNYTFWLTLLNVIRPQEILPNTRSSMDRWATIIRYDKTCFALHGNKYQANSSYTSLISSKAAPNCSPNSHIHKIKQNDQNIAMDKLMISVELIVSCRPRKRKIKNSLIWPLYAHNSTVPQNAKMPWWTGKIQWFTQNLIYSNFQSRVITTNYSYTN